MEKDLKFNSAICTSRSQSERLLALGLKKETADMVHYFSQSLAECWTIVPLDNGEVAKNDDLEIPAWSMCRLIEILGPHRLPIHFRKKGRVDITTSHINHACSGRSGYNYYDSIIDCIAWLINEGYDYFNKDYLEEKK